MLGDPELGRAGDVSFILPFEAGVDVAAGIEEAGGFDEEFVYVEAKPSWDSARAPSESSRRSARRATSSTACTSPTTPPTRRTWKPTSITGTNVGAYAQLLYKHDDFPLFAKVRATFGDVEGVMFAAGVAF